MDKYLVENSGESVTNRCLYGVCASLESNKYKANRVRVICPYSKRSENSFMVV